MAIEINARKREAQGTGASRRLRRTGKVPGIIYGGDQQPMNIELDHKDLFQNLRNEKFHASILSLDLSGSKQQVLLRAVNMHPFRLEVQHVDFQRVSKDKKIHMKVPMHFVNADKSPGVKEQGGVVSHILNELDIVCLPDDLPEFIQVDLSALTVAHSIHIKDLALPKGVEAVLHRNENPVVATIVIPKIVTEDEEVAVVSAADVPATAQAAPADAAAGAAGAAAKGGDKAGAEKAGDKGADKAGDKGGEKKEKK